MATLWAISPLGFMRSRGDRRHRQASALGWLGNLHVQDDNPLQMPGALTICGYDAALFRHDCPKGCTDAVRAELQRDIIHPNSISRNDVAVGFGATFPVFGKAATANCSALARFTKLASGCSCSLRKKITVRFEGT